VVEGTSPLHRWVIYALTLCLSGVIALWLTPRMRDAAIRFGIVDKPDGRLKRQAQPVPYLGGLAIYLAFLVALALTFEFSDQVLGMLLAGSIVVILGLLDDLGQLGPLIKICGQLVAIWVLIKSGIFIQLTFIPPEIAYPMTVIWLLATINAFNLLDIMDGLSTGTAILAALSLMVIADLDGGIASATMAAALAGACIGFLRFNRYPAQIYMGDTGSMFLGLMLGALAISNSYTAHNRLGALAPALILGVPLFDTLFVMYIRWRRGLPVMLGSPDHVALRLRRWRLDTRQTVWVSNTATGILCLAAIGMTLVSMWFAVIIVAVLLLISIVLGFFLKRIDMSL
jgi:UDP-GlcNAc:undecaprenyl-phosphate GlcNAc-1-phosphate transferase